MLAVHRLSVRGTKTRRTRGSAAWACTIAAIDTRPPPICAAPVPSLHGTGPFTYACIPHSFLRVLYLAQEFNFPDYSDDELHTIFRDLIANDAEPRFKLADARHLRIAARRVGRQRGHVGFGNARAVRNAYEAAQKRQAARVVSERAAGLQPDLLLLAREDLLGPRELYVGSCAALRELQGMVGLKQVKQQVGGGWWLGGGVVTVHRGGNACGGVACSG